MLAFSILNKLIKKNPIQTTIQKSTLKGLDIKSDPPIKEWLNPASLGKDLEITVSGSAPSASSEIAQKLTSVGAAYGLSHLVSEKRSSEQVSARANDVPAVLGISLASWLTSSLLQSYVFDGILGYEIKQPIKFTSKLDLDVNVGLEEQIKKSANENQELVEVAKGLAASQITSNIWDWVSFGLNAYHGYKRHDGSILSALGWGLFGNVGMAIEQGFGLPIDGSKYDMSNHPELLPISNPKQKRRSSAKKSSAKRASAKRASAKRSSAKKSSAKKSSAKKSSAKKSSAKRASAKRSSVKRSSAKRSSAKKR